MHYTVADILIFYIIIIIIVIFSFHFSFHFLSLLSFFYRYPPLTPLVWYRFCKRAPVPRSSKAHALRMYQSGLKQLQSRDNKYYRKEQNKDWSSCTFMPVINRPSPHLQKKSGSVQKKGDDDDDDDKEKDGEKNQENSIKVKTTTTCDVGCTAGPSILSTSHKAATAIQNLGRGKNEKILYARKRAASIAIQKHARGKSKRKDFQETRRKKKIQEKKKKNEEEAAAKKLLRQAETDKELGEIARQKELTAKEAAETELQQQQDAVKKTTQDIVNAGAALRQKQTQKKMDEKKKKEKTKEATSKTIKQRTPEEQEKFDLQAIIGMTYGAALVYRKKESDAFWRSSAAKNGEEIELITFVEFFLNVMVLRDMCENDILKRDSQIVEFKRQVRKYSDTSKRVFWFGTMLGWLPSTKDLPFSHDSASAYLKVLESSGLVSTYDYDMSSPSTETPLLSKTPCLVNEHALTKAMLDVFTRTSNEEEEEVKTCIGKIQAGAFGGKTDFDLGMHLFMSAWFATVGRFKAAWGDDQAPRSPAGSPKEGTKVKGPG